MSGAINTCLASLTTERERCVHVCGCGCSEWRASFVGDGGCLRANQIQILPNLGVGASVVFVKLCVLIWSAMLVSLKLSL